MSKENQSNLPAVSSQSILQKLKTYDPKKYNVLMPFEGDFNISPLIKAETVEVRIDTRLVKSGGEVHNIHGKFRPNAPATNRILEAGGITITSEDTKRTGDYIWTSTVWGKKRNPDGTWREAHGGYEFDANLRGEELRQQMKGKSEHEIEGEILKLKKFGHQRASTGATLVMIYRLTGLPSAFESIEALARTIIITRFVINTEALLADPATRKAVINTALGAKEQIYGPEKQLEHKPQYEVSVNGQEDEVPFDELPEPEPEKDEIEKGITYLRELVKIKHLHKDARAIALEEINRDEHTLDTINGLIERLEGWLSNPETEKKYGKFASMRGVIS